MKRPNITPGKCEHEHCACKGTGDMELNGLRFVCINETGHSSQCTLECHVDDFPAYAALPDLLATLERTYTDLEDFLKPNGDFQWSSPAGASMLRGVKEALTKAGYTFDS